MSNSQSGSLIFHGIQTGFPKEGEKFDRNKRIYEENAKMDPREIVSGDINSN
jgi:hypothetical protein